MKAISNPVTAAHLCMAFASAQHFVRMADLDERVTEWNPVYACCWEELGGGMVYYAEGVDPNLDPTAKRIIVEDHGRPWS